MSEYNSNEVCDITKLSIRQKIWKHLEDADIALFPRPVFNRIPNYKGAQAACQNIASLDEFKNAKSIKVNPDKPQEEIRFLALENNKKLYVPTPRLKSGLINRIEVPKAANKAVLRTCASYDGIREFGREIDLDEDVQVDLVVTGCVAVSKDGWRIGKGEGFADLEYAMMVSLRIITPETLVITSVHDSQVLEIPSCIMRPYDMPVDIIVTPTQVIRCPRRAPTPGIIWGELTAGKLSCIPILNVLREREYALGFDVTLKKEEGVDTVVRGRGRCSGRGRYQGRGASNGEFLTGRERRNSDDTARGYRGRAVGGRRGRRGNREGVRAFNAHSGIHQSSEDTSKYEVISFTDFISKHNENN